LKSLVQEEQSNRRDVDPADHHTRQEAGMKSGESGKRLGELIKKACDDLEITTSEYKEIMSAAGEDSLEDGQEKSLLSQFHQMISNGTIKRIPG
jgi:hypothetical protein